MFQIFQKLLIFFTYINIITPEKHQCPSMDVSLTQKIENEGFHREIHWLLEKNPKLNCNLSLRMDIKREFYLNQDQIADLNRIGALAVYIKNQVDVEAPAHLASENVAYIFIPKGERVSIKLPFHLRYQRSQITGGFGRVIVTKPSLLAICPDDCKEIGEKLVKGPCDVESGTICTWRNVTYEALFDEVELFVPIGDLDDYPLVSIVTLLLGCAGCIYTLSVLSTTPL